MQLNAWTELTVGGFMLISLVGVVLFVFVESRAKEPIIPLGLFRIWTYTSSMIATFFAAFAFFGSIIFLPRWFQFVQGYSRDRVRVRGVPAARRAHRQLDHLGPGRRRGPAATSG